MAFSRQLNSNLKPSENVLLANINDSVVDDPNLEPQFVRVRAPNSCRIYLDSQVVRLETNPANILISSISSAGQSPQTLLDRVRRVAVSDFTVYYNSPNVNPRNNTVSFFIDTGAGINTYTCIVDVGYYSDSADLMTALTDAMNGIAFPYVFLPAPNILTFQSYSITTSAPWCFDANCVGVTKGAQLWALPFSYRNNLFSTTWHTGSQYLQYTKYIDVVSNSLSQYTKKPSVSNNDLSFNPLYRAPIDNYGKNTDSVINLSWFNFYRDAALTSIDVKLVDQFGDELYLQPSNAVGGVPSDDNNGFFWSLTLLAEL